MQGRRPTLELTPDQAEEFCRKLAEDNGYPTVIPVDAEQYVVVKPLLFHWTVMRGLYVFPEFVEERWCYATEQLARAAVENWRAAGWQGEPTGWHRHPTTGRRRPDGLEEKEYVEW